MSILYLNYVSVISASFGAFYAKRRSIFLLVKNDGMRTATYSQTNDICQLIQIYYVLILYIKKHDLNWEVFFKAPLDRPAQIQGRFND
jgi:hypothetical protein